MSFSITQVHTNIQRNKQVSLALSVGDGFPDTKSQSQLHTYIAALLVHIKITYVLSITYPTSMYVCMYV